jgi:hypothetical protein
LNAIKLLRELRRPRVSETTGEIGFNGSVNSKKGCIGFSFIRFTRSTKLAFAKRIELSDLIPTATKAERESLKWQHQSFDGTEKSNITQESS